MEKRRRRCDLPAQSKMRLETHDDGNRPRDRLALELSPKTGSVDDKAGITRLRSGHDRPS